MAQDDQGPLDPPDFPDNPTEPQDDPEEPTDLVRARLVSPMNGHFIPGGDLPEVPPEGVLVSRDVADLIKTRAKDAGVTISARKE